MIIVSFCFIFNITFVLIKYNYMLPENHTESQVDHLFTNPEKWEDWESNLVFGSIAIAFFSLLFLAILINFLILD